MGNNISINSTDAMNPANFQNYFNDFPLLAAPTSTQADNCRIFAMSLDLRYSTSNQTQYQLYADQRSSAYWQMWGNGMGGFPSTNTASFSTCADGAIERVGAGQYQVEFDQFVGFPLAILGKAETGITDARAIVTGAGTIRIDTYNASGTPTSVSSTTGIGIELLMIGKAV